MWYFMQNDEEIGGNEGEFQENRKKKEYRILYTGSLPINPAYCRRGRACGPRGIWPRKGERKMQKGRVRFLEEGEKPVLPGWTRLLPAAWREGYLYSRRPYRLEEREGVWEGVLQITKERAMEEGWRKKAAALLEAMGQEGAGIVIPPAEGEIPRGFLPIAEGRQMAALFAFAGAAEALRRQGKTPERAAYLIAGGEKGIWERAFSSMGNEVNRLGIFTDEKHDAEAAAERLYEERGLLAEVFSSPKNPYFQAADVVLCCGMAQRSYEHMLKEGCVWLDLAGNRPVLRRLMRLRPDIMAAEGFYFRQGEDTGQMEGREAEAEAYIGCPAFRRLWQREGEPGEEAFDALSGLGYRVSGFSALGKRVKIAKG